PLLGTNNNVVLSSRYQAPPQGLDTIDTDLEIVGENRAEMEVEVDYNSLVVVGDDGELYGIDDVESYIEIVVKKVVDDIFKGISDKVDMDMVEEVVKKLKNKEAADKQRTTKSKTYKRRKTTTRLKPTRKL
ncbi:hypothetical protein Dimus_030136, partial [Dionaea muscipula]